MGSTRRCRVAFGGSPKALLVFPLGGGTVVPPNLPLGTTPLFIETHEPSTLALVALGLGTLFMIRRRSTVRARSFPLLVLVFATQADVNRCRPGCPEKKKC
jgi:hypothetical protein